MGIDCAVFTLRKTSFMLSANIVLLTLTSCSNLSIYDESKYWTQYKTEIINQQTLFITYSLPPGAKIINVPPRDITHPKHLEYTLVSADYFHLGRTFADVHLTIILYNVSKYFANELTLLSNELYKDHNIVSHNKNSVWFKNQGEVLNLKGKSVLYRVGYSTGPNEDQKLPNKVEYAYVLRLSEKYVLGVYAHQYTKNTETQNFLKLLPQLLENISVRML